MNRPPGASPEVSAPCAGSLLSVKEVGELLRMRRVQVRRLVLAGAFGPAQRDARGHFRVHEQGVVAFRRDAGHLALPRSARTWRSEMFWLYDQNMP